MYFVYDVTRKVSFSTEEFFVGDNRPSLKYIFYITRREPHRTVKSRRRESVTVRKI